MRVVAVGAAVAAALAVAAARAEDAAFAPDKLAAGAAIYARNCSPCHGPRMQDPESAFDLRKFPREDHARFVVSVTRGKNQMPPWGDLLTRDEIEALWAYVSTGEAR
jgi:mono/diheme cytochrome c family protein